MNSALRVGLALLLCSSVTTGWTQDTAAADTASATASESPATPPAASDGVIDDRWALVPMAGAVLSDSSDLDSGPFYGLRLMKPLTDRISLDFGVDYANLETTNAGDYERLSVRAGGMLFLGRPFRERSSDAQVFLSGGGHVSNLEFLGTDTSAFGGYVGGGLLQRFSPRISGVFEARYQLDDVQNKGVLVDEIFYTWHALAGVRIALGARPVDPDGDDDGDGVPNRRDRCPDTPPNTPVDIHGCPLDSDGDGVLDRDDECPNTPPGVQVDRRGCPLDSDGDGVPDAYDQCPNTPAGVEVDARGCPLKDSDGDGVPDIRDACPDTPAGIEVDERGCPLDRDGDGVPDYLDECPDSPAGAVVLPDGCALVGDCRRPRPGEAVDERGCALDRSFILRGVKFEFDSAVLTPAARAILDKVAVTLQAYTDIEVELEGHTDNIGTPAYNLGLSERRAISVKNYLISKGVPAARMVPVGYGLSRPIADNTTEEGREENRRVELTPR